MNQLALTPRQKTVLRYVVERFISTSEPVSSKMICRWKELNLSSASVRKCMYELEKMGLLFQPHTSAGRIPTAKGYRVFVDEIMPAKEPPLKIKKWITDQLEKSARSFTELMDCVSKTLSELSYNTGLVLAPSIEEISFSYIDLIPIDPYKIMAIVVTTLGEVIAKIIMMEEKYSEEELAAIGRILMDNYKNMPISEIKRRLNQIIQEQRQICDYLMRKAFLLGFYVFHIEPADKNLFIDGSFNLIKLNKIYCLKEIEELLKTLEEKRKIIALLDKLKINPGVKIVIGSEARLPEFKNISLVTHTYGIKNKALGTLGVMGPLSMEYPRVVPIVSFMARSLSNILSSEIYLNSF